MADFRRIKPLRGRVTVRFGKVKLKDDAVQLPSGLYAPANRAEFLHDDFRGDDEKNNEGFVVAVGAPARDSFGNVLTPDFDPGDRVYAKRQWGSLLAETDDEEIRIFNQSEIAAVIEPEDA